VLAKFVRYVVTGGTAAVVDLVGFAILQTFALPIVVCASASWIVAAVVNYLLTSRFVFSHRPSTSHGLMFISVAAIGLAINAGVTTICAEYLAVPPIAAKAIGIGTAFFFNFLANVRIVYR